MITKPITRSAMALTSATRRRRRIMRELDDSEVGADRESKGKTTEEARLRLRLERWLAFRVRVLLPGRLSRHGIRLEKGLRRVRRGRSVRHGAIDAGQSENRLPRPGSIQRLTKDRRIGIVPRIHPNGAQRGANAHSHTGRPVGPEASEVR